METEIEIHGSKALEIQTNIQILNCVSALNFGTMLIQEFMLGLVENYFLKIASILMQSHILLQI